MAEKHKIKLDPDGKMVEVDLKKPERRFLLTQIHFDIWAPTNWEDSDAELVLPVVEEAAERAKHAILGEFEWQTDGKVSYLLEQVVVKRWEQ
jgi:hypothetical protein